MIAALLRKLASHFDSTLWSQAEGIALCRQLFEYNLQQYNAYPALTGGTLYKFGRRKDLDVLFYPSNCNGRHAYIKKEDLLNRLHAKGFTILSDSGYLVKAKWQGKDIDFFFTGYYWAQAKKWEPSSKGDNGYTDERDTRPIRIRTVHRDYTEHHHEGASVQPRQPASPAG